MSPTEFLLGEFAVVVQARGQEVLRQALAEVARGADLLEEAQRLRRGHPVGHGGHVALGLTLTELVRRNISLTELRTHSATLEDVFVTLTGRHLRDE